MLTFRGDLQELGPPIRNLMLVGHDGSTLYKLYAVPVRVSSTREDMHYPWGYALPMSRIISTRESYPQYLWSYAVPVSHILSTHENMQYPWVISSVPVSHILSPGRICRTRESSSVHVRVCSICEDMQYLWGKFHSFFIHINLVTGTEDTTPQFLICQVDLFEDDRKVTPSAGCSFLYVCFLMVGTYCNWRLTAMWIRISNANHWGTTTGHFGIQKIIHWLSVAL